MACPLFILRPSSRTVRGTKEILLLGIKLASARKGFRFSAVKKVCSSVLSKFPCWGFFFRPNAVVKPG